ncbi:hypothetical protein ISN34_12065 [Xanthomonas translucens pv. translucens]|uniref:Stability determinant domain-containing protein n=2 Tax=Xanthomonas campestris pv. translucens TaxID=343 RepID=A0ABW9KPF5_XANCT|nr:hypothetical protein [Xanthomonas translucens]QSQ47464.1 hypothetical protein ISN34_12065 [Xanthomonas translucens pv. translucens]
MPGRRGLLGARRLGQLAFVGQAQAESEAGGEGFGEACIYDRWFLAKIERAVADTRPTISHDQVMAHAHAAIEAAAKRQKRTDYLADLPD